MLHAFGLDSETLENKFRALKHDIKLIFFTRESGCPHCKDARTLFETVASITHKIEFDSFNFAIDAEKDQEYHIIAVPALAIIGERDYGIRYYGCPEGMALNNFLDDILYVSRGESNLKADVALKLARYKKPIQLKIFISPTCPYSLPVAKLALKIAIASDDIMVDIIHADEFLELAQKYKVRGLPMTVVNEKKRFYGALDAEEFVNRIIELA